MASWTTQRRRRQQLRALAIGLALLMWTLPLAWTALASLGIVPDNSQSPPTWSRSPTIGAYAAIAAVDRDLAHQVVASAGLAVVVTLLALTVGLPASYGLVRSTRLSRIWLVQACLVLSSLPVMAYVLPLDDTLRRVGLHATLAGTVAAETAVFSALAVYALCGYVAKLSVDLEDAARLEGASTLRVLWSVVVPSTASGLVATGLVLFVLDWNLLLVPLVVGAPANRTVPVAMVDFFTLDRGVEWPPAAAALIISLLPPALIVSVAHRALERFSLPIAFQGD
ncbi:MAG: carbohydrate ABC transporter permease [Chloroflexota bacterium]|nr:carbohydrate ABC transporter permease [Chloroflexota bacterium]